MEDFFKISANVQIAGALLLIAFLLLFIAFGGKIPKNR